jgi:hypothetical protein
MGYFRFKSASIMNYYSLISSMLKATISSLLTSLYAVYKGESNANDSLGVYNGTPYGGLTYTAGKSGNAFTFNGTTAYVSLPNNAFNSLTGDFSISLWVNFSSFSSIQCLLSSYIFTPGVNDGFIGFRLVYFPSGSISFSLADINSVSTVLYTNNYSLLTSVFYNIVIIRKASTGTKIYINGSLSANNTDSRNPAYVTTYPAIGTAQYLLNNTTWYMSNGSKIDELNIWNKELTATEVTDLYNSGAGKFYPTF